MLVTAFVLAFTVSAQATFRGFTPIRTQAEVDAGILQGFITFPEARVEMARNDVPAALAGTAHGGYVTSTTKCAVCHSAHRASGVNNQPRDIYAWSNPGGSGNAWEVTRTVPAAAEGDQASSTGGDINLANVRNQFFLTAGSTTCEGCHVSHGAQASRLLVEWGGPTTGYTGGGPHGAPARGCTMCHNAGIHGLSGSRFNVMNAFMLGSTRGTVRGAAPTVAESRDEQIIREVLENRVLRGGILDVPANSDTFNNRAPAGTPTAVTTWWYDGIRELGPIGGVPASLDENNATRASFAAARSLATAYTCGEAGCHTTSAMFNLNWGMGFDRADSIRTTADHLPPENRMVRVGDVEITGHVLPSIRVAGGNNQACGPCHGGNPAGFPTASSVAGRRDDSRRAYGCDQCHDMVGVATNSTAWPHGNRRIQVYEWDAAGVQHEITAEAGNLWMYGGSIARSTAIGTVNNSNQQGNVNGGPLNGQAFTDVGGGNSFRGATSENLSFADQSWTVLTGVGSGRYGMLGAGTGLTDGSCLKCHVALDTASRTAGDHVGADALRHAWTRSGGAADPSWDGVLFTGSSRLFLYR